MVAGDADFSIAAAETSLLTVLISQAAQTLEQKYFKGETLSRGEPSALDR